MPLSPALGEHRFNGPYTGENLERIAFPIGGMGAGMFCLEGSGAVSHMSVLHEMEFFHEPSTYAAICILPKDGETPRARVLQGPLPDWKYFGMPNSGNGNGRSTYGFPRFRRAEFVARFPFARIDLADAEMPVEVTLEGWSPFIPCDADMSSLPLGALEYRFRNTTDAPQKAVFSFNTQNYMGGGSIGSTENGFVLYRTAGENRGQQGAFAWFVDQPNTVVDHCWFRGGWFDAKTITWNNVRKGILVENPPQPSNAPGASLFVPFELPPNGEKTIRLHAAWYVPTSNLSYGRETSGPAFRAAPSKGTAEGQQQVTGFLGKGLVNTFEPDGDGPVGTLTSPAIPLNKRYLHFLVGGGPFEDRTCVQLMVDGQVVQSTCGQESEQLRWASFDLSKWQEEEGRIRIVDRASGGWGHILADHFLLSDEPIDELKTNGGEITGDPKRVVLLQDFEGEDYGKWAADPPFTQDGTEGCGATDCCPATPEHYIPWYATRFDSIEGVVHFWKKQYDVLKKRSRRFSKTFYDTNLPPEVIEAVAANMTILKSPTILRQHDGRLWCWEGCCDSHGCCAGSCTHVWNYAQAICHLFPSLERSLRRNEYFEGQSETGRQAFRMNLPTTDGGGAFDASDGQLGGIMKAYREWRISGDHHWLVGFWPKIKASMHYMIEKYDPRHTGLLEEEHHNTYDINYFGPDGHCGSFYLGALAAMVEMGEAVGDDTSLYRRLLEKGTRRMEEELYNGEYFIQIIQKEGLHHNFVPQKPEIQSPAYQPVVEIINRQGPKYQYGSGCLSDGVLGLWMAKVCGLEEEIIDREKVRSHLLAIHKYNLKHDLSTHANPQRPTFAMGNDGGLLLCTWPHGNEPLLPFVYSNEVWTGIEYQVASHLMLLGCVDEGLDIVRTCRKRYDGRRRNPFNEYECGHWYARAMSSYGLLQGLTGAGYDAVTKTLRVDSQIGDFKSFLSTDSGYGSVIFEDGKVRLEVVEGKIPVGKIDIR